VIIGSVLNIASGISGGERLHHGFIKGKGCSPSLLLLGKEAPVRGER